MQESKPVSLLWDQSTSPDEVYLDLKCQGRKISLTILDEILPEISPQRLVIPEYLQRILDRITVENQEHITTPKPLTKRQRRRLKGKAKGLTSKKMEI